MILLMEEIWLTTWHVKNLVNNGTKTTNLKWYRILSINGYLKRCAYIETRRKKIVPNRWLFLPFASAPFTLKKFTSKTSEVTLIAFKCLV